ncbi:MULTISPECIES: hemerythrin domain-containing protein [Arcobacter]|jgi:hemerythrin-like domain-containing protein|uniref:Hemerythrin HHE cation-binding domain-containing protein n=1 Tax=Arcobacter ellisii TaxID=913109 RepID=A0A347U6K3_9BACT|nr:hemerythrin domain-containing protein [Arcobacter ellisii]AXX94481.1 hemerythrin HHE cation-binding domain-containing protein [Arcobacter ellisii]RXI31179.1 hemerythrin HHE cation-binding protein [Arcobacter ellisii]
MSTISSFLTADHRACDEEFANLENAVASSNWEEAKVKMEKFASDLLHHFEMEEKVMFPTFEEVTGMREGPTMIMTMEHNQMRQLLNSLKEDLEKKDKNHFFGVSESLMMLMQQHNMKEEQMLYRMADAHLGGLVSQVLDNMKAI